VRRELTLDHPINQTNLTNKLTNADLAPFKAAKALSGAAATANDWHNLLVKKSDLTATENKIKTVLFGNTTDPLPNN